MGDNETVAVCIVYIQEEEGSIQKKSQVLYVDREFLDKSQSKEWRIEYLSEITLNKIIDIESYCEVDGCFGCKYDCPGQWDHIDCPNGCLHDPEFCEWCS